MKNEKGDAHMKKRILAILLALALVVALLPAIPAFAASYDLYVCGVQVTDENSMDIFGDGKANEIAAAHKIASVASLPIDPAVAAAVDAGQVETVDVSALDGVLDAILKN